MNIFFRYQELLRGRRFWLRDKRARELWAASPLAPPLGDPRFRQARRFPTPLLGGLLPSFADDASLADHASAHFGRTNSMSNLRL
jgi:hypothetical protein